MLIPCQCLREDVRRIVGSVDVVVLHNLPLMQVIAIVVAYLNMPRPGLADAGGDMRERALGVGVNLRRGKLVRSALPGLSIAGMPSISRSNFRSHLASLEASEQAMYSASVVDEATRSFFRIAMRWHRCSE